MSIKDRALEAADFLRKKVPGIPRAAVVLGSGLGAFAESLEDAVSIPYGEIPGWAQSTAPGHAGRLSAGRVGGVPVVALQGRLHYYEGYSMADVTFPVRVLGEWGVENYIATNASGGINHGFRPGDIVLVHDHINFLGENPLRGANEDDWGPRFPDMSAVYDEGLMETAERCASRTGIQLRRGIYIAFGGPSFETPAEIRMARQMGADAVGMSTVPEVIVARHMGMRVCVFSCVANYAAGMTGKSLSHEEVLDAMQKTSGRLVRLLLDFLPEVAGSHV
ncbi:MAG: purine-nucleoside phosphorylase [Thermovirgaceae bacterium]